MTTKVKQLLLIPVLLVGMAACELIGDLDKMVPPNKMVEKNAVTDAKSAEALLNGVYVSWRTDNIGTMRHLLNGLTGTWDKTPHMGGDEFILNDVKIDNTFNQYYYSSVYLVVNEATSFLHILDQKKDVKGLSESRRAEMNGEARILRAQAYLMLLRYYGDFFNTDSKYGILLYGDEPIRDNQPKARSSVADTYKAILADLDYAIANAPKVQPKHYRVGQLTAQALKARVLLYTKEFRKAADLATKVLSDAKAAGSGIEGNFEKMFVNSFDSPEMLFALHATNPNELYGSLSDWNSFAPGGTINKIARSFIKGKIDSRFSQVFVNPVPGIPNKKYPEKESDIKQSSHYYLRLAEMYYIIAEAETRIGRIAEARKALKEIICHPRAGYSDDYVTKIPDGEMLKAILEHKWMEFATENNEEWIDLVRYRAWDKFEIKPYYVRSDAHLVLPIPKKALGANKLLIQNPGYPEK